VDDRVDDGVSGSVPDSPPSMKPAVGEVSLGLFSTSELLMAVLIM
jgi:hypothetical protein